MAYLTDMEIAEIIYPYLVDNTTKFFEFLTEDMIDPKYRVMPKNKILYRGTRINKEDYDRAKSADSVIATDSFKYYRSYTSSLSNAKDFARDIMGNDYDHSGKFLHSLKMNRNKKPKIGIVYQVKLEDDSNIVLAVGRFLRTANLDKNLKTFASENEWIMRGLRIDITKSNIVFTTDKIF